MIHCPLRASLGYCRRMTSSPQSPKQLLVEKLLDMGMVMVILDARRPGVIVPPSLASDARLRLNLSHRFPTPMSIDTWGVKAVLTFQGVAFECKLPWDAVYVVFSHSSGDPFVFPDDVPAEAFAAVADAMNHPPDRPEAPLKRPPTLHVVSGAPAEDGPPANTEAEPPPEPPVPAPGARRGHLRVVK
jgi:stringent starvation protein B